jgi:hypothetical protein
MSEKLAQVEAKYAELCDTVAQLRTQMSEFRKLFEPEGVDFDDIDEILFHMLGDIDDQLLEENL